MPTPQDNALSLTLAGVPIDGVARATGLTPDAVEDAVVTALELRHPDLPLQTALEIEQMQTLWRKAYADGIAGDPGSVKLALDIAQELRLLRARAMVVDEPETATAGIRDAWTGLALGAMEATATLRELIRSGVSESVRQRAAATLLSRVGITERVELAASVRVATQAMDPDDASTVGKSAAQVVNERLDAIAARRRQMQVIDAEPFPDDAAAAEG